jgi:hypothetical protein
MVLMYRFGTEANLIWPRIVAPFKFSQQVFCSQNKATLGYEFQNRTKLLCKTLKGSFGYSERKRTQGTLASNITEITYASPQNVTALYQDKSMQMHR